MTIKKLITLIIFCLAITEVLVGQNFTLSGTVTDKKDNQPIEFATVAINEQALWGITNSKGKFTIKKLSKGKITITTISLGYVKNTMEINVDKDIDNLKIELTMDNLALEEVVVTAKHKQSSACTSYKINRNALNHIQVINASDVQSLLPGGQTNKNMTLLSNSPFSLRSEAGGELGTPSFGTAIEVDGVRLNNNESFNKYSKSADVRAISSTNIESVEILTGVTSVENGDLETGVVKIKTRKGKSPYKIEATTNMNTKLIAINKGFSLGKKGGVINTSFEHAKSISNLMSPYTSYKRNSLSLNYSKSLNIADNPLLCSAGIAGNIGGYNSESDPDFFAETFKKQKHNTIRANIKLKYLPNLPWITNIHFFTSVTYANKLFTEQKRKSSSSSRPAIHTTEIGYFVGEKYADNPNSNIILVEPGYWYEKSFDDSKPLHLKTKIKANLIKNIGKINSYTKIGADFSSSGDFGDGEYYETLELAPTWRPYKYKDVPFMNNLAGFAEEKITIPFGNKNTIQLKAGVRSDNTWIKESVYGNVNSLSPRFNFKYTKSFTDKAIKKINAYASYGQNVKLPSFYVLHPTPSYHDLLVFAPGTMANGRVFYGFYTRPNEVIYNPNLQWQKSSLAELGFDIKVNKIYVSLSAYYRKTHNPFTRQYLYSPFTYKLTTQEALEHCPIPSGNRKYSIDQQTGIVTVTDITNTYAPQQLEYKELGEFKATSNHINGTPLHRLGLEWIVDFGKIKLLNTSFRIDGNYYYYKGTQENDQATNAGMNMSDGSPYKYISYYKGGYSITNGSINKHLRNNLTITKHIPKIRLIVSVRVESSIFEFHKPLSEYNGKQRGFVLDDKKDYFPSETKTDIYAGNQYVAIYPEYYVTFDDMNTKIPFAEKLKWAKEHDKALFNELVQMINKSNYLEFFNEDKVSAYFSANLNITKEIGDHVSISFNATNFFNNMGKVSYTRYDRRSSLYAGKSGSEIPPFYYGMTVRIKV